MPIILAIVGFVSKGAGLWLVIGLGAVSAGGYALHVYHGRAAAEALVILRTDELHRNAAALAELTAHAAANERALEAQAVQSAALTSRLETIRGHVNASPDTSNCVDSAAISAVLDGLRDGPAAAAGNPGGEAARPGQPAALPTAPDAPGVPTNR